MRDVAEAAGVALETVYSHFSSKRGLLRAVTDAAAVGDDAAVAMAERPEFKAMGQGSYTERIRAAVRLAAAVNVRTGALAKLLREAAPSDSEIAEMLQATRERQRADVATAVALITGRAPTVAERDGAWALVSPEAYLLLVEQSHWSIEQYEAWLEATLVRVIPRS